MNADDRSIGMALVSSRVLTAAVMAAIFVTMTALALGFPPGARLMPLLAGVPGSVLALICLGREIRLALEEAAPDMSEARRVEAAMLAWTFAFFVGILAAGFLVVVPVLVVTYLRRAANETWLTAFLGAAATWAVLYGLFELAFRIPLFDGLLLSVLVT